MPEQEKQLSNLLYVPGIEFNEKSLFPSLLEKIKPYYFNDHYSDFNYYDGLIKTIQTDLEGIVEEIKNGISDLNADNVLKYSEDLNKNIKFLIESKKIAWKGEISYRVEKTKNKIIEFIDTHRSLDIITHSAGFLTTIKAIYELSKTNNNFEINNLIAFCPWILDPMKFNSENFKNTNLPKNIKTKKFNQDLVKKCFTKKDNIYLLEDFYNLLLKGEKNLAKMVNKVNKKIKTTTLIVPINDKFIPAQHALWDLANLFNSQNYYFDDKNYGHLTPSKKIKEMPDEITNLVMAIINNNNLSSWKNNKFTPLQT